MTETAPTLSAVKPPAPQVFAAVRAISHAGCFLRRDEAEALCRAALERDPGDAEALAGLGYLAIVWDHPDRAVALLTQAIGLAEANGTDVAVRAEMLLQLGHAEGIRGQTAAAEAAYRAVIALCPRHLDALNTLGLFLRGNGRPAEAAAVFQSMIDIKPTHAGAIRRKGTALLLTGDREGAEASYRHALEVKPDYVEAFINLAEVLEAKGDADGALDALRAAVSLKYDFSPSHQALGDLLARRGETGEATALLVRAATLASGHAAPHLSLIRLGYRW